MTALERGWLTGLVALCPLGSVNLCVWYSAKNGRWPINYSSVIKTANCDPSMLYPEVVIRRIDSLVIKQEIPKYRIDMMARLVTMI